MQRDGEVRRMGLSYGVVTGLRAVQAQETR